jgi:hypothetical protein
LAVVLGLFGVVQGAVLVQPVLAVADVVDLEPGGGMRCPGAGLPELERVAAPLAVVVRATQYTG